MRIEEEFKNHQIKEPDFDKIWIKANEQALKSKGHKPQKTLIYLASAATLILFSFVVWISFNEEIMTVATITDEETEPEVPLVQQTEDMIELHYMSDSMDRGNHDYYDKTVLINPHFNQADLKRGTVVYHDWNSEYDTLSRVIGLPGETVKITEGQIYINDKRLDTFYGSVLRLGRNEDEYFKMIENTEGVTVNKESMQEMFRKNLDEITLGENEFFLAGDDWFRGNQGVVSLDEMIGIAEGYKDPE